MRGLVFRHSPCRLSAANPDEESGRERGGWWAIATSTHERQLLWNDTLAYYGRRHAGEVAHASNGAPTHHENGPAGSRNKVKAQEQQLRYSLGSAYAAIGLLLACTPHGHSSCARQLDPARRSGLEWQQQSPKRRQGLLCATPNRQSQWPRGGALHESLPKPAAVVSVRG